MLLADLISSGLARRLAAVEITTTEQLIAFSLRELAALPGIGPGSLARIVAAVDEADLVFAFDEWAPYVCARDGRSAGDVGLATFFLCTACRRDYETLALNDTAPEWVGSERISGYCGHCDQLVNDVRVAQWLLCGVCERVVRSIGRGLAAARYVIEFWNREIAIHMPGITLGDTDPPQLQPRSKQTIADKFSTADYTAVDVNGNTLFGFELKTGKKAVAGGGIGAPMNRFQLDTTDCDDILTVTRREHVPVYLVHAQVVGRAKAPTERYVGLGLWWSDPWTMTSNFMNVDTRARETQAAAYYKTAMFRPLSTFVNHYLSGGVEADTARLAAYGPPALYYTGTNP